MKQKSYTSSTVILPKQKTGDELTAYICPHCNAEGYNVETESYGSLKRFDDRMDHDVFSCNHGFGECYVCYVPYYCKECKNIFVMYHVVYKSIILKNMALLAFFASMLSVFTTFLNISIDTGESIGITVLSGLLTIFALCAKLWNEHEKIPESFDEYFKNMKYEESELMKLEIAKFDSDTPIKLIEQPVDPVLIPTEIPTVFTPQYR